MVLKKDLIIANHDRFLASKKTIPHLDTVAGDACYKSSTSNIIVIHLVNLMISPEVKHNFLLSSNTVFMFSIQTASTGPSNTIHSLYGISPLAANSLIIFGKIPSVQDLVSISNNPYN